MSKVFNFSAGPAMIFPEVLQKAQAELTNWLGQGVSVMEVSHRGKYFMELIAQAEKDLREVYHIPDNYRVLFLQGGARGQFAALPMNLIGEKGKALYLNSGHWSAAAAKEARNFAEIDEITIVENGEHTRITNLDFSDIAEQYDYVHYCPNEPSVVWKFLMYQMWAMLFSWQICHLISFLVKLILANLVLFMPVHKKILVLQGLHSSLFAMI